MDLAIVVEPDGTEELPSVPRRLDGDHGLLLVLLRPRRL